MTERVAMLMHFRVDKQPYELALMASFGFGLTPREAGRIKALASGAAGTDIALAFEKGDVEVLAALAIVAMERTGVTPDVDAILDGKAKLEFDEPTFPDRSPTVAAVVAAVDTAPASTPMPVGIGAP